MKRSGKQKARAAEPTPRKLFPEAGSRILRVREPLRDLMVLTSDEELVRWNRRRIVEVLVREAAVDADQAEAISARVEAQLIAADLRAVSTSLIRELVGAELVSLGLAAQRARHARLGVSLYDVGRILDGSDPARVAADRPFDPEATSLTLARRIKRDYALAGVFSERVAEAHRKGDLHIHDLSTVDRPESIWLTLDGLQRAGGDARLADARPATTAEGLFGQMARLYGALSSHVSGSIGIEHLNVSLAPYLVGRSKRALQDACAALYAELARVNARGSRSRIAAGIAWDIPAEVAQATATGPGGEPAGRFADHAETARRVAVALLEAAAEAPDAGVVPELVLVMGPLFFRTPGHLALLELAADVATRIGVPRFRFVRERDLEAARREQVAAPAAAEPERARAKGVQPRRVAPHRLCRRAVLSTVSISLPRLALGSGGMDEETVDARLYAALEIAARAHQERRVYLEQLLARGRSGPLGFLVEGGGPILSLDESVHRILPTGLNELVEIMLGVGLTDREDALALGCRILERMRRHVSSLGRKQRLRFEVAALPLAEPAARFAKLDLRYHSPNAGHHVKGTLASGQVSYTPGVGLGPLPGLAALKRLRVEGSLHAAVDAAAALVASDTLRRRQSAGQFLMEAYLKTDIRELWVV